MDDYQRYRDYEQQDTINDDYKSKSNFLKSINIDLKEE